MTQPKIYSIVEGDGEVEALPVLLLRWLHSADQQRYDLGVARPHNAKSGKKILNTDWFERQLQIAHLNKDCAAILVLLDLEDDCPVEIARSLATRTRKLNLSVPVAIVCAVREYETWFLASIESLAGQKIKGTILIPEGTQYPDEPESKRNAKGELQRFFPPRRIYKETSDQPAFTNLIDFALAAERSRSFRRLLHALEEVLMAFDEQKNTITPQATDNENS